MQHLKLRDEQTRKTRRERERENNLEELLGETLNSFDDQARVSELLHEKLDTVASVAVAGERGVPLGDDEGQLEGGDDLALLRLHLLKKPSEIKSGRG